MSERDRRSTETYRFGMRFTARKRIVGRAMRVYVRLTHLPLAGVRVLVSVSLAVPMTFVLPAAAHAERAQQMIIVSAPTSTSVTASLTAYERAGGSWKVVLGPIPAKLGELGVGVSQDDVFRTPVGTFPLGQAFGRQPNPGTRMPYFQATEADWWDEDVNSPTYNMRVHGAEIDSDDAENLFDSGVMYDYAVLIDHNPQRIAGRSAGIFLHVTDGDPTWGCVAIGRDEMRSVLQWLDPSVHPQIMIGVGLGGPSEFA